MTREIKFRGKIAFGGYNGGDGWIYGNLTGSPTHPYIQEVKGLGNDFYHLQSTEVVPKSVGQFTGLHDKNGKEIYEGDIVRFNQKFLIENTLLVCYEYSHRGGFSLCTKEGYYSMFGEAWLEPFYCEVIGNIHDNKELLKRGE